MDENTENAADVVEGDPDAQAADQPDTDGAGGEAEFLDPGTDAAASLDDEDDPDAAAGDELDVDPLEQEG